MSNTNEHDARKAFPDAVRAQPAYVMPLTEACSQLGLSPYMIVTGFKNSDPTFPPVSVINGGRDRTRRYIRHADLIAIKRWIDSKSETTER